MDIDFATLYASPAIPWDIAAPQPAIVEWEAAGRFTGDVLDIGCGLGDNATYLAARGHTVTGLDATPAAIDLARERAGDSTVTFAVADAFALPAGRYDTILDCALYHCVPEDRRREYATARPAPAPGSTCWPSATAPRKAPRPPGSPNPSCARPCPPPAGRSPRCARTRSPR